MRADRLRGRVSARGKLPAQCGFVIIGGDGSDPQISAEC